MTKHNFNSRTEETRDDWQTPIEIVKALGEFFLDPCANCDDPKRLATCGITKEEDGLAQKWFGRVWLNPPYGGQSKFWVKKLGEHGNGIALIPPRCGANWFHEFVFEKADAIFFLHRRIQFISPSTGKPVKGNNADSVLVAFGDENVQALRDCGLPGKLWVIDHG